MSPHVSIPLHQQFLIYSESFPPVPFLLAWPPVFLFYFIFLFWYH